MKLPALLVEVEDDAAPLMEPYVGQFINCVVCLPCYEAAYRVSTAMEDGQAVVLQAGGRLFPVLVLSVSANPPMMEVFL